MAGEMEDLRSRPGEGLEMFQRMVEEFYGVGRSRGGRGAEVWAPATDVFETAEGIAIKLAVPDIDPADVRVVFGGETITVSGCRQRHCEPGATAVHQMEIRTGYFERSITLNRHYDSARVTWSYENGILCLRLPKAKKRAARTYMIQLRG